MTPLTASADIDREPDAFPKLSDGALAENCVHDHLGTYS